MTDIAEFLTARLDEDATDAKAALNHVGFLTKTDLPRWVQAVNEESAECVYTTAPFGNAVKVAACDSDVFTAHIARHDPARVLAEIAAKRAIVAEYHRITEDRDQADLWRRERIDALEEVLRNLAAPHAEHPDYDPGWRIDV